MHTPVLTARVDTNGLVPSELHGLGARVLCARTYELVVRPGVEVVQRQGGAHRFLGWQDVLITDGGGLPDDSTTAGTRKRAQRARLIGVDDDGVTFTSHVDGSRVRLTPESSIAAQQALGADVMVALDPPASAPGRTVDWARRALAARAHSGAIVWGVVEPAVTADLAALALDGAVLSGRPKTAAELVPKLPPWWPRHARDIASLPELLAWVEAGADLLDSALPTRLALLGRVYTSGGEISLTSELLRDSIAPIEPECGCETCRDGFGRGYLRHLFASDELLAYTLATQHNLYFLQKLMARIGRAIEEDALDHVRTELQRAYGVA